jgi:RNA polymerase sigma-70 factor (ECF subfamily)
MAQVTGPADGRPDILFERLLRPHFDALFGRAYRLTGNVADAEDLVQDLCVRVYPRIADLDGLDNPRAWLMRVLHRLFIDLARSRQRSPLRPLSGDKDEALDAVSGEPGPERQVDGIVAHARLLRAWRFLDHEQRVLLVLQSIDGHSLAEIEAITGITQGTLKSKLHRARARLGKLLAREERPTIAELRGTNHELRRHRKFAG